MFIYKDANVRMQILDPSFDHITQCTYHSLLIPPSNVYCMYCPRNHMSQYMNYFIYNLRTILSEKVYLNNLIAMNFLWVNQTFQIQIFNKFYQHKLSTWKKICIDKQKQINIVTIFSSWFTFSNLIHIMFEKTVAIFWNIMVLHDKKKDNSCIYHLIDQNLNFRYPPF